LGDTEQWILRKGIKVDSRYYLHECPETHRLFLCEEGVDNNIAEVFDRERWSEYTQRTGVVRWVWVVAVRGRGEEEDYDACERICLTWEAARRSLEQDYGELRDHRVERIASLDHHVWRGTGEYEGWWFSALPMFVEG